MSQRTWPRLSPSETGPKRQALKTPIDQVTGDPNEVSSGYVPQLNPPRLARSLIPTSVYLDLFAVRQVGDKSSKH